MQQVFPVMSEDQVNRLIAEQDLYLAEVDRNQKIGVFLSALKSYRENTQIRVSLGLPIEAPPMPPAGYVLIETETPSTAPPVLGERIVGARNDNGTYSDYGKQLDPKGTVIDNPHGQGQLVKVIRQTPFGAAHYWEEKK